MREAKELNEPTELYYAQPLEVKDRCDREFVQNIYLKVEIYICVHLLQASGRVCYSLYLWLRRIQWI